MIISTAGHVDHGKTLLVKALTGVDADRLPDEKRRGLTIDLGFAYLPLDAHTTIGFIDVPGHERFIRNALCGLSGTDFILLIVAADDGPMPQTHEHVAIIDLLGISNGCVALTKIDRASPARVSDVSSGIQKLLAPTALSGAPIFPVSALTLTGISKLKAHLSACAQKKAAHSSSGNFRLAIDRKFDVSGAGLVVTGTVFSGAIEVGETVEVLGAGMALRVRGLHAQNTAAKRSVAGERCALNLSGQDLKKNKIGRGDWIVNGQLPAPSVKFDAKISVLQSEPSPLAHWTPVHVHLGAAESTGRIALLEEETLAPGAGGLAQIILDKPIGAVFGDRLILRDQSAQRTIAGGYVIDMFPPQQGRAKPQRLAWLRAMSGKADLSALTRLMAIDGLGVDLNRFAQNRNLTYRGRAKVVNASKAIVIKSPKGDIALSQHHWERLKRIALERLQNWHMTSPAAAGLDSTKLFEGTELKAPRNLASAVADKLVHEKICVRESLGVRLPGHTAQLEERDVQLWELVQTSFARHEPRPTTARDIAREIGANVKRIETLLLQAGRTGLVARISKTRYVTTSNLKSLAAIATRLAVNSKNGLLIVSDFRDATGIGRNMTIEVLEYFDKQRFTQRKGEGRLVMQPADKAFKLL